jgi:hypothetical protein
MRIARQHDLPVFMALEHLLGWADPDRGKEEL